MIKPNEVKDMYSILSVFLEHQRKTGQQRVRLTFSEKHLSELVDMIGMLKDYMEKEGVDDGK